MELVNPLVDEVKKKKQFSELLDSVIGRALAISKNNVKKTRALLRKYFGVFLTNKILKARELNEGILQRHISSRDRDYNLLYKRIFDLVGNVRSVVDLGAGINGFSYKFLPKRINYVGVEAVGQLVGLMNRYFFQQGFDACAIHVDIFDLDFVSELLKKSAKPRLVFLFQVIDALEFFERGFSEKFLLKISKECEFIVLSFAVRSLSGKSKFMAERKRLKEFLERNFEILDSFTIKNEKFLIIKNKK